MRISPRPRAENAYRREWGVGDRTLIVVAEDESIIRMDLVESLRELGCDVVGEAGDGETALALVRGLLPDVALLDIQMPIMDGYTAPRTIRQWEREHGHPPLTIVALTAHAMSGDRERFLAEGFNDYVSKPIVDEALLFDAIARHLTAPKA